MRFGIICAMPEEIKELKAQLTNESTKQIGGKDYYFGQISGQDVVLVESGIGKVEAGITTEHLITDCGADVVINSGSAGGIGDGLHVGDVVISTATAYHDVDATAFDYQYGQLPGKEPSFAASKKWGDALAKAGEQTGLTVKQGLIVSGDQFIASQDAIKQILAHFPDALSSEMEGAAVGQVATDHQVPYVVVRAMSDTGDEEAGVSFDEFIIEAGKRSAAMLLQLFKDLAA
ncbi:MAG: 5'-methylthioadenosine/adenosylhomocysteine nucleosidase [Limosilactobacillus oris]|jgi:adenosylhomocysteine nucleosidase|uniref:5'-methylthioadenosine/adenosylhomocysteine nucleosidase n=1 Tax=Limosilactobacillus oris TaxID=1632 RepID=UPI0021B2270C|nr:5'-methylthioadenosine/adenosylhomocysteine nucleosidase [Limosilactobacillus oris]MCH3911931.1 5'-methylthioadenosine/adenosylhomocysteine nucleosidase [Limosilactobacillus oris]MCH3939183.1 5'-methylthioadenosine/adenosylhomocysteine nucleosidase [Limosilactobacillus oris]MCI1980416.1 5'-methylthioadenosine/adenosylhomocysteine nucleosidase [Limosilactobacillus oris]MCI2042773.1 5'-methylthioadenosine/adenosylhomocysteine nucleosidase [Limosilactobacillus oris]UXC67434.1 5'-methylthioaden